MNGLGLRVGREGEGCMICVLGAGPIWVFPKIRDTILGAPYNKDYSILGSILGFPLFWEITNLKNNAGSISVGQYALKMIYP